MNLLGVHDVRPETVLSGLSVVISGITAVSATVFSYLQIRSARKIKAMELGAQFITKEKLDWIADFQKKFDAFLNATGPIPQHLLSRDELFQRNQAIKSASFSILIHMNHVDLEHPFFTTLGETTKAAVVLSENWTPENQKAYSVSAEKLVRFAAKILEEARVSLNQTMKNW